MKVALLTHREGAHIAAYLLALAKARDCDEVILADPDQRWLKDARKILGEKLTRTYATCSDLLTQERPQLCLISMEAKQAPAVVEEALESGSHVFAEKPACISLDQFEKLATLAESKHLHLMMAFSNRVNPETLRARRIISEGRLGALFSVDMHIVADQTRLTRAAYQQSWFADRDRAGGGHLIWLGIHWLDLAMYLTGTVITEVNGSIANVGRQPITAEDSAVASLQFSNGMLGSMNSGYYLDTGYHTQIRIWGSKGWLNVDSIGAPKLTWYENDRPPADRLQTMQEPTEPRGYSPFVDRVVTAVARDVAPPITTTESLNTMRTVFSIYRAAETRRTIHTNTMPIGE